MRYAPLLLVVLIVSAPGSIGVIEQSQTIDTSKMSSELLSTLDSEERIEAIVQFHDSPGDFTWESVESIGIEVISKMSVLHGGLITGSGEEIAELSTRSFVSHIEANVQIEHFYLPGDQDDYESMMHETVRWVNASLAWHRAIIGTDGVLKTESDLSLSEYDGKGATAVDLDTGIDDNTQISIVESLGLVRKLIWSAKWTREASRRPQLQLRHVQWSRDTRVGGTIAGNGDASGGRRLRTAKGATIVALGTGDGASILAAVEGLEWTYEHSRPGLNDYNIRVVSNSWGTKTEITTLKRSHGSDRHADL